MQEASLHYWVLQHEVDGDLSDLVPGNAKAFRARRETSAATWILASDVPTDGLAGTARRMESDARARLVAHGLLHVVAEFGQPGQRVPGASACLMPLAFEAPEAELAYLDRFYVQEHIPILLECPTWRRARVCHVEEHWVGPRWNRVVLHELETPESLTHPAVAKAREAPMMQRLTQLEWFTEPPRAVHERHPSS